MIRMLVLLSVFTFVVPPGQLSVATAQPQDEIARIKSMHDQCEKLRIAGKYDEVIKTAEEALKLSTALGDKSLIAFSLLHLGNGKQYQNNLEEALQSYQRSHSLAVEVGDKKLQATTLGNIGAIHHRRGQSHQALDLYLRSLRVYREIADRNSEMRTLTNMGSLYTSVGDYDKAEPLLQEALQLARELKNRLIEQGALRSLGVLEMRRDRLQSAINYYEQALALGAEGTDANVRRNLLINIANTYLKAGEHQKAIDSYQSVLEMARATGDKQQEALIMGNIGVGYERLKRHEEALDWYTRGRALMRRTGDFLPDEVGQVFGIGFNQRRLGRAEEALQSYRETISLIDKMRAKAIPNEITRASIIATRRKVYLQTIDLLAELKRDSEALEIAEQYHGRTFLDLLAESKIDLRQELTPAQREQEERIFGRISDIQRELRKEQNLPDREKELKAELSAAENDFEALSLELRRTNPSYANLQYPKPLSLDQIQRELLDPETALIEYVVGEKTIYAFSITKQKIALSLLRKPVQMEEFIKAYRQTLGEKVSMLTLNRQLALFEAQSRQLYDLVFKPLETALAGVRRIIIVPDGPLAYLPFESLGGAEARYLLERFSIAYAPSASALNFIKAREMQRAPRAKTLIAFGDPAYNLKTRASERETSAVPDTSVLSSYLERGFDLNQLPYTRVEVTEIGSFFPAAKRQLLLGADAREQMVKTEKLGDYRYIHFAAHGFLDEERPGRSGIILSLGDTNEDGILQMGEIMRLRLNAELVTLSACRTGLGKLLNGEGLIGLSRAFFYSGASSVVASLWNVNDLATAELMKAFYQNLNKGISKDEALKHAKLALIKGKQRAWQHPYFWAPFVLVGERQ